MVACKSRTTATRAARVMMGLVALLFVSAAVSAPTPYVITNSNSNSNSNGNLVAGSGKSNGNSTAIPPPPPAAHPPSCCCPLCCQANKDVCKSTAANGTVPDGEGASSLLPPPPPPPAVNGTVPDGEGEGASSLPPPPPPPFPPAAPQASAPSHAISCCCPLCCNMTNKSCTGTRPQQKLNLTIVEVDDSTNGNGDPTSSERLSSSYRYGVVVAGGQETSSSEGFEAGVSTVAVPRRLLIAALTVLVGAVVFA